MTPPEYLALWYRALEAEFGIAIKCNDQALTRYDLYQARKAAGDPRLEALAITVMKDGTLWIVKRGVEMEDGNAPALT
jgi:hypothetical protein